jgi:peptidoglycan/xylan/chitin deacetylase (PgdA/CDA1 family)
MISLQPHLKKLRSSLRKLRPQTWTFVSAAAAVVLISLLLDLWRGSEEKVGEKVPRFSGSTVIAEMASLLPAARLPARIRVAVVRDGAAASFYDSPATFDSIVNTWRDELVAIGADVRVVTPSALAAERAARVIVIPSSPCMTVATREAIEAAAGRGQGVILTGLAGVYDAGCRWIGYGLIVGMTHATRVEVLDSRNMVYVVVPAGNPLSADIPPGARVELSPAGQIALRHRTREAYYSDYALQPQPAGAKPLLDGALVRATRGNGRVVYWGFELRNVVPRSWNRAVARLLVRNSVAWAGRLPIDWIEPWPRGRRAAAIFAQDVEYQFDNARYALDSLRAAGIPGTFFLTTKLASRYRRLTRELAAGGEVGTHSSTHTMLGGAPENVQRERLEATQRDLTRLLGSPVAGLRPPGEQFDVATMAAWLAVGGNYVFGANDTRAAAPELLRIGSDTLVLIGRIAGDDFAVAGNAGHHDARLIGSLFLNELAQVRALGGLYPFSYHSQLLARPELVPVVARVARAIAADTGVWAATTSEVAEWWRDRAALRTESNVTSNALVVTVRNRGPRPVSGAVARTVLEEPRRVVGATTRLLASEAGVVRLALPVIPAGATRSFTVRFDGGKGHTTERAARRGIRGRPVRPKPPWWQFWRRN